MIPLPVDVQARIERALAALERAVIRMQQNPPLPRPDGDGGSYYIGGQSPTDVIRTAVLTALAVIVDVVTAAHLTAAERRQIVAAYQDHLLTQYAIHPLRFQDELRAQSFWDRFQQTLQQAEQTDIPSVGQQLKKAMKNLRINAEWLVEKTTEAKTPVSKRTIERLRADERPARIDTIGALEAALTKAQNGVPFRFLLPTASPRRRKSRPPRKRSQNAATRR